ncbi:ketoacyl-ACP synthase III family protein [Kitasatospora sp. NA04385]|uniref:ketoacyl-ACP synthase III family protein n=1 Tax=Kitasatospora sp. NA04385 TaxID=2742135 RepID=UPI001590BC0E|nr:ketoacyl-ACP synthase III family protein [Kitasatospora sp. NA04385]QKW21678.1 ketoacyl-ACP synthase III family protein [Kitasatospora sp. NA04385]
MRTPNIYLGALGVHLPDRVDTEDAIARGQCDADQLAVHGLTGALVAEDTPAVDLAVAAGRAAMERYGWSGEEFDAFIHVDVFNQGLELWHPGAYVARRLDARPVPAYEVRQACTGVLAAFELAVGQLAADPDRQSVMITSADNFSHPNTDRWRLCPGFLFGDAGTAVVLTRRPGFARLRAVNTVTISALEQMHRGVEPMYPPHLPLEQPIDLVRRMVEFRTHGGEAVAAGRDLLVKGQDELIRRTLDEAGVELSDVTRVAFTHMSGKGTEDRVMEPLGLPMSASTFEIGRSLGHAGASDPLLDLDQLLLRGELAAGDHLLVVGLGAGITLGAAVVEILDPAAHLPVQAGPRDASGPTG